MNCIYEGPWVSKLYKFIICLTRSRIYPLLDDIKARQYFAAADSAGLLANATTMTVNSINTDMQGGNKFFKEIFTFT